MKKSLIILICLITGGYSVTAAIWRVNNNPGVACDYTNFTQEVIDNASAGDTIHIEGSVTPYNATVQVDKELYILGPGYDLTANTETQHYKQSAKINSIKFSSGSEKSVLAGVEHMAHAQATTTGITVAITGTTWTGPRITVAASNIKIINCRLYWIDIDNSGTGELKDIDIKKCWFSPGLVRTTTANGANILGLNIGNNFFRNQHATSAYSTIILDSNTTANIISNTFYGGFVVTVTNSSTINNNVFFNISNKVATALTNDPTNSYNYNIFNVASLGGMINAQNNNVQNLETVPLNWFSGSGGNELVDAYFSAKSGSPSPIIDAGGVAINQLGMYGGLSPYNLSGLTSIPAVYEIVMPNEVSADGFDVTIKVRAH
ncbi:MAG: hypothetical protein LBQ60_05765 [Bacteroidales bacterium]|jgi:hypothetical protein|nr:hypothetical protein [Bacteroidales bacterium]